MDAEPRMGRGGSRKRCGEKVSELSRAASVKRTDTLQATLFEFCLKGLPSDALGAVVIDRYEVTLNLGLLGRRQSHLVVIPAVPKLRETAK
jgi:hypothetical protein